MHRIVSFRRLIGIALGISVLALFIPLAGCAGPAAPPGPAVVAPGASIVVVPNVVDLGDKALKQIDVYASGFTPNKRVVIGLDGLHWGDTKTPFWGDVVTPNEYGAFSARVLMVGVKAAVKEQGVYTVIAVSDDGAVATAPLVITKKE